MQSLSPATPPPRTILPAGILYVSDWSRVLQRRRGLALRAESRRQGRLLRRCRSAGQRVGRRGAQRRLCCLKCSCVTSQEGQGGGMIEPAQLRRREGRGGQELGKALTPSLCPVSLHGLTDCKNQKARQRPGCMNASMHGWANLQCIQGWAREQSRRRALAAATHQA